MAARYPITVDVGKLHEESSNYFELEAVLAIIAAQSRQGHGEISVEQLKEILKSGGLAKLLEIINQRAKELDKKNAKDRKKMQEETKAANRTVDQVDNQKVQQQTIVNEIIQGLADVIPLASQLPEVTNAEAIERVEDRINEALIPK